MNDLEFVIKKHAVKTYGDLIIPDKPVYDDNSKTWEVKLRSTYPRIIRDEMSGETLVGFLNLKNLGRIRLNDKLQVIDYTTREKCDDQLSSRLDYWKRQAENIVISVASDVFAKIEESIHVLNPLELILDQLTATLRNGEIKILDKEIFEQRNPERIMQYLELLQELDITRRVEGGYIHGNTYVELFKQVDNDSSKLRTVIISYVIKHKYSTLRQVFGIRQLEPFVHLANAYYSASLEAGKLIHISRPHLKQRYEAFYKKITTWEFKQKLDGLIEKGALQYEHEYLVGKKDYFDNMMKMKQVVELNPMM